MDPRRSLISPHLVRAAAAVAACGLAFLPAACATAPQPTATPVVTPIALAPAHIEVLALTTPPEISLTGCRARRLREKSSPYRKAHLVRVSCRTSPAAAQPTPVRLLVPARPAEPVLIRAVLPIPAAPAPHPARLPEPGFARPSPRLATVSGPVDHMEGAVHVLAYSSGRVYPVVTAPLRVTTLSLQPGETLIDKAAGDTVRWQIGETTSGEGASAHSLVMIKPLTAGLATNMVLTTSQRVYLLDLTSRAREPDRAVAWAYAEPARSVPAEAKPLILSAAAQPAPLDKVTTRYRISPAGRPPRWTPLSVFDDGKQTFIAFRPDLAQGSAPLLFVDDAEGREAIVNYRQAGDLFIVDRLFDRAELRLGDRRPEVVRLIREPGDAR